MVDAVTRERVQVIGEPLDGAHIIVAEEQLPAVERALTDARVKYWVSDEAFSLDDEPPVVFVEFSRKTDKAALQRVLDGI